jgi:hypothetical protein
VVTTAAPATAAAPQYPKWITDILTAIQAPISSTTADNLAAWNECEASNAKNNAFNTTLPEPGSTSINNLGGGVGVQSYPNYSTGLEGTVNTLLGTAAFRPIVQALRTGADRATFATTVGSSGWGTSGACIASAKGLSGAPTGNSGAGGTGGYTPSATAGASSGSASGSASGCDQKGDVISLPLGISFTACEAKAVIGAASMVAGGVLMLAGALILARGPVLKAAASAASAAGSAGSAAKQVATRTAPPARTEPVSRPELVAADRAAARRAKAKPPPDEDDLMAARSRRSAAENRAAYRRAMGGPSDTSDLTRRTA